MGCGAPGVQALVLAALLLFPVVTFAHGHDHGHEHRHRHALNSTDTSSSLACGTERPSAAELQERRLGSAHRDVVEHIYAHVGARRRELQSDASAAYLVIPRMVYHVVRDGSQGFVSDALLQYQHDRLNQAFAPYVEFTAWERRDYDDGQVFSKGCEERRTLMREFQADNADTTALNTYLLNCVDVQLFGYAYLPYDFAEDSTNQGVVIDYRTIKGNVCSGGCNGATAVHEWGHGFGLYHTFESLAVDSPACDCTWGDLVDDTPPEASPASGGHDNCNRLKRRDTCTEDGKNDPVWNFMDYSDDECMERFTEGQFYRMLYILAETKPNMLADSLGRWCTPGTFMNEVENRCQVCPEGTYQDEAGASTCKPCPPGSEMQSVFGGQDESLNLGLRVNQGQCYASADCAFSWLGDSYCDAVNNNRECFFDGGDCCEECCASSAGSGFECGAGNVGHSGFQQCGDPTCSGSSLFLQNTQPGKCANYFAATHFPTLTPSEFRSQSPTVAPYIEPSAIQSPLEPTVVAPTRTPLQPTEEPSVVPSAVPTTAPSEVSRGTLVLELYVTELPFEPDERPLIFKMEEVLVEVLYAQFGVSSLDGSIAAATLYATTNKPSPTDRRLDVYMSARRIGRKTLALDPQWFLKAEISIPNDILAATVLNGAFSATEALQFADVQFQHDVRAGRLSIVVADTISEWPEPIDISADFFRRGRILFITKQDYLEGGNTSEDGDSSSDSPVTVVQAWMLYFGGLVLALLGVALFGVYLLLGPSRKDDVPERDETLSASY